MTRQEPAINRKQAVAVPVEKRANERRQKGAGQRADRQAAGDEAAAPPELVLQGVHEHAEHRVDERRLSISDGGHRQGHPPASIGSGQSLPQPGPGDRTCEPGGHAPLPPPRLWPGSQPRKARWRARRNRDGTFACTKPPGNRLETRLSAGGAQTGQALLHSAQMVDGMGQGAECATEGLWPVEGRTRDDCFHRFEGWASSSCSDTQ